MRNWVLVSVFSVLAQAADLASGPPLPHRVVNDWAQLPKGWNFGECSGVDVDKDDNVWVFNRGPHPVVEFDRNGKFLQAWSEAPVTSSHGLKVGPDGNIWLVDVKGHTVFEFTPAGKLRMVIGSPYKRPGNQESKDAFNEPTGIAFAPSGDFYVSDGYANSRIVQFSRDGVYRRHWGFPGVNDGDFRLPHDVAVDSRGRVYVADRTNYRVQVFDADGKFLAKWIGLGSPWGLYYVARENALYMCDGFNSRILKLNLEGQVLGVLAGRGKTEGLLDYIHHLAVDSTGAIYAVEIKNWRVQKFVAAR